MAGANGLRAAGPFVSVLTPEGRGAISVVRVWGRGAVELVDAVFRPATGRRLAEGRPGRPRLGRTGAGLGDEVVAVLIDGEPPEVEVHGHGGPAAVALVVEALVAVGGERRRPSAWIRRNARSRVEAEALVDLARAPTARAAEVLLEQVQGALEREVAEIGRRIQDDDAEAPPALDRLIARAAVGLRLVGGWSVVLAGRPNVGKSRLLNALAGYERAIVSPTPGTTRDVVTVRTALDGWPIELSDTAGLRAGADEIEAEGVARARAQHAEADLKLLLLDRSGSLTDADREWLATWPDALVVASKVDLPAAWTPAETQLLVSAERGIGLEALIAAIVARTVPATPPPGAGVPFRRRHARALEQARNALKAGDARSAATVLEAFGV